MHKGIFGNIYRFIHQIIDIFHEVGSTHCCKDRTHYKSNKLQSFIAYICLGEEKYSSQFFVCTVRVFVQHLEVIFCSKRWLIDQMHVIFHVNMQRKLASPQMSPKVTLLVAFKYSKISFYTVHFSHDLELIICQFSYIKINMP